MRSFSATPLTTAEIDRAYVLVAAVMPDVTLAAWRAHAGRYIAGGEAFGTGGGDLQPSGCIVLRGEGGYLCGLCIYRCEDDLRHGRILRATHFLAMDVVDSVHVAAALLDCLDSVAAQQGCQAIHTLLPQQDRTLIAQFQSNGHRLEEVGLCKTLPPAVPAGALP